ncbi:limkain-b1-type NYN domain-containing protein [Geranomyces variabilis]|nr:limkain-b1-type NYN domain-containing protein [Geranomyces variabilis]KAJ3142351.1 hypothetical protein HDU90_004624 [Geranomyces variabilis]
MVDVGVFWDYENCQPPKGMSGERVVAGIRESLRDCGQIVQFKSYLEVSALKGADLHAELTMAGVSLVLCPPQGKKETADSMIVADMMAFCLDHPAPAIIVLISGDGDFAYPLSRMNDRQYTILLIINNETAVETLRNPAIDVIDWRHLLEASQ